MKCPHCGKNHSDDLIDCPSTGKKLKKACHKEGCSYYGEYLFPLSMKSCPCCGTEFINNTDSKSNSGSINRLIETISISNEHHRTISASIVSEQNEEPVIALTKRKPYSSAISYPRPFRDSKTGKFGYSHLFDIVIPAKFDYAAPFSENGTAPVRIDGKNFRIDEKGNIIDEYSYVIPIDGGYRLPYDCSSLVLRYNRETKKYGYSYQDKIVIPIIYDTATNFHDGSASVSKNGKKYKLRIAGDCIFEQEL